MKIVNTPCYVLTCGSRYETFFRMVTHYAERDRESRLKYLVLSSLILNVLKDCQYDTGPDDAEALEIIHEVIQIQDVNTHPILTLDHNDNRTRVGLTKVGGLRL